MFINKKIPHKRSNYDDLIPTIFCSVFTASMIVAVTFSLSIVAIFRNLYIVEKQDELIALVNSLPMMGPSEHENVSLISSISSNSEISMDYELNQRSSWSDELYNNEYIIDGSFQLPDNAIKINHDTYLISEIDLSYTEDERGKVNYNFNSNSNSNSNNKRDDLSVWRTKRIQVIAHIHKSSDSEEVMSNANTDNFATTCYVFNAEGAIWKRKENYYVTPTNNDNIASNTVYSGIQTAMNVWQSKIPDHQVFGTLSGTSNGVVSNEPDGKNEFIFGSISSNGVIAVTITYGVFSGPVANREIIEWDMIFNHIDYNFGDATVRSNVMDLLSILTHEFGHVLGLGDLYSSSCSIQTMYGYSSEGQTNKRTLEQADITGIKKLYGESLPSSGGGSTGTKAPKSELTNESSSLNRISYMTLILFVSALLQFTL